jgi:hypothetical protein
MRNSHVRQADPTKLIIANVGTVGVFVDVINCAKLGVGIFKISDSEGQPLSHKESISPLQLCWRYHAARYDNSKLSDFKTCSKCHGQ